MTNTDIVFRIISHIPRGSVLTYGDVAKLAGMRSPRVIGNILHTNQDPIAVPCHRIVNAHGRVSSAYSMGGAKMHAMRLRSEGVPLRGQTADMVRQWKPSREYAAYVQLLRQFGDPGPWPWFGKDRPHTPDEIAIGAILTQHTSWRNVDYAMRNLREYGVVTLDAVVKLSSERLKKLIRPSGFFNQKAMRLQGFAKWIASEYGSLGTLMEFPAQSVRSALISQSGIGNETADTILLYCGEHAEFVIDAYMKRFSSVYSLSSETEYDELKRHFMQKLPAHLELYRDYHALVIAWGQQTPRRL